MSNTINAYDADVRAPQFLGLKQYGDLMNGNPAYAVESVNMNTKGGVLMPMAAVQQLQGVTEIGEEKIKIETLMKVNRRWPEDEVIIAAGGGRIFRYNDDAGEWELIPMPDDYPDDFFHLSTWSWVDYEVAVPDDEENPTHDVILLSNKDDGLFMYDSFANSLKQIPTPYNFGVIERHAERIWGAAITDHPDRLIYSAPYDPEDWCERDPAYVDDPTEWKKNGQPEDGAGEIDQPSWDGDSFIGLKTFGDQLIAFKRTRVWRILGTNPGVYEFKEQYGGGSYVAKTIAVDSERIYMLSKTGVMIYDGSTVEPFGKEYAYTVWNRLNLNSIDEACGCLWEHKYYLAVALDGSEFNNAVVTYDLHDGTWVVRDDLAVESFLPCEHALYFTTVEEPYALYRYLEDAWETGTATEAKQVWVSPWNNLNFPNKNKGPFRFYFTPEVQDKPVDFTITLDTEKWSKSKTVRVYPLLGYEQRMKREAKTIRVPFSHSGRRFRFTIECEGGNVWRIQGGIHINMDQETEDG